MGLIDRILYYSKQAHDLIKEKLKELIEQTFNRNDFLFGL